MTPGTYQVSVALSYGEVDGACGSNQMIQPAFLAISPIQFGSSAGIGPPAISIYQAAPVTPPITITVIVNPAVIPEYPPGLSVLAVFMVIAYGVIRRRIVANIPSAYPS